MSRWFTASLVNWSGYPATQYMEEADHLAGHIAVIDHGQVIAHGTPNELKAKIGGKVLEV